MIHYIGAWHFNRFAKQVLITLGTLALLTLSFCAHTAPEFKIPVLRQCIVLGLNSDEKAELHEILPFSPGAALRSEDVASFEQQLKDANLPYDRLEVSLRPVPKLKLPQDDQTRVAKDEVDLILDFRGPILISGITILPLTDIKTDSLLSVCPLRPQEIYSPEAIESAIEVLTAEARRLGHSYAKVSAHTVASSESTVAIRFIVEGPQPVGLKQLKFPGAGFLNGDRLRNVFKHLESGSFEKGTGVTAERLKESESLATEYLRSLGYLDAQARLSETSVTAKGVEVVYEIERGKRYRFAESRITGQQFTEATYWNQVAENYTGKIITYARLRDLEDALEYQAQTEGYMEPEVRLGFEKAPEAQRITVVGNINEGTTSKLGEVIIERTPPDRGYGESWYHRTVAPKLAESVLRRSIRAKMGEPLNAELTEDIMRRVWRLGTFDDVEVDTVATTDSLVRDLCVKVKDRRTASVGASLGWSAEVGPIARFSLSEGNVGGRADGLGLAVSASGAGFGGELTYLDRHWKRGERWLGIERDPSLLWSIYLNDRSYRGYTERHAGAGWRVDYLRKNDLRGLWSNAWELKLDHVSYSTYYDRDEYEEEFNSYLATTLGYHLIYNTLNLDEWESTRGMLFRTSLESGAADGMLLKWLTSLEWRHPLTRRLTYLTQGEVGLMPTDAESVGLAHRFHAGGETGVRGFRYRGMGPVDEKEDGVHTGGATMLTWRNELRIRLNDSMQLPIFLDVGTLDENPFQFGSPRASAGAGFRYLFPDKSKEAYVYLAKNFLKEDTDDDMSIRFGFTYAFGPRKKHEDEN